MRIFYFFLLIGFLVACSELAKPEQLIKIEKIDNKLDSLLFILKKENNEEFNKKIIENNFMVAQFLSNSKGDTLFEPEARKIVAFHTTTKRLECIQKEMIELTSLIQTQKKTLKDLKNDVENGFGKRNLYLKNICFENTKATQIDKKTCYLVSQKHKLISLTKRIH